MRRALWLLAALAAALVVATGCKPASPSGGAKSAPKPTASASVQKFTPLTWHRVLEPQSGAQTLEELLAQHGGTQPEGVDFVLGAKEQFQPQVYFALEKAPIVTSDDIQDVQAVHAGFGPTVDFTLTPEAGERFRQFTRDHIGETVAIVLDHHVISAPRIQSEIGARGVIQGNFTPKEIDDLVRRLKK
jgi:preprotein translocase subunit SecD